jgi:hypothetical protein
MYTCSAACVDVAPPAAAPPLTLTPVHEHVRGRDYYQ